jgi:drug/metabolite transporter (DMT)-like permease
MFKSFRTPLSKGEIVGYLVFVAGLVILAWRGVLHDGWVTGAAFLMAIGAGAAGRAETSRSSAP